MRGPGKFLLPGAERVAAALRRRYLIDRFNSLGANLREERRHGELSGIDGVELAGGGDADLVAAMQLTGRIVNVGLTPGHDRPAFDAGFGKAFRVELAKRRHDIGKSAESSRENARAQRLCRVSRLIGRR